MSKNVNLDEVRDSVWEWEGDDLPKGGVQIESGVVLKATWLVRISNAFANSGRSPKLNWLRYLKSLSQSYKKSRMAGANRI